MLMNQGKDGETEIIKTNFASAAELPDGPSPMKVFFAVLGISLILFVVFNWQEILLVMAGGPKC
jgi:hypothetical protein